MGLFAQSVDTVPGRALVAPESTAREGTREDNVNNLSANARVRCRIVLEPLTADGRGERQSVRAQLPNWLRIVLCHVGSNYDPGPSLPAELDIPVRFEAGTTRIVDVDVDATAAELERYREMGRREWLETEAPLSDLRAAAKLPRAALGLPRALVGGVRDLVDDVRGIGSQPDGPAKPTMSPKEIEQLRRTSAQQRHLFATDPKLREKARASVLQAAPQVVSGVAAGTRAPSDVDAWIMSHEVSELLSPGEAAQMRRDAGLS